ncbi:MAG TPA: hypothetical protein VM915_15285 [Verrucomicrobiae bacterium]|jgi:hypothetical protein|nr:hypothetical protein [Verrucomicrobiae bacterium]
MSTSLAREYDEAVEREMRSWPGVCYEITASAKHRRVVVSYGGQARPVSMPSTPSDSRYGVRNFLGDLRRALRDLGAVREQQERSARREKHYAPARPASPPVITDPRPDGLAELRDLYARMQAANDCAAPEVVAPPRRSLTKRFFDWLNGVRP